LERLSLRSLSAAGTVAVDFTEEEVSTEVVEVFTEEAGSGAEDFTAGVVAEAEGFMVEVDSAADPFVAAARFGAESVFVGAPSMEVFMARAFTVAGVGADEAGVGEAGAGVGA